MTRECTDERLGRMLYAYELGMCTDEQRHAVELHILECAACHDRAGRFGDAARLLRHDPEVRVTATVEADAAPRPATRVRFGIAKYLVAAAVILAIGLPTYWFGFRGDEGPAVVQRIDLVPVRDAANTVLYRDRGGDVEFRFYVEGALPTVAYRVTITSHAGDVVFSDDSFSKFSDAGAGLLVLPAQSFVEGLYVLTVTDSAGETSTSAMTYTFRVE